MSYKSILVPIDGSKEADRRLEVAAGLASIFEAHLTGIRVVAPLELPQRLRSNPRAKAILKEEFEKALATAKELVRKFPETARAAGAPRADARIAQAEPLEALASAARSADLLVLSQPHADDIGALGEHFIERILVDSSCPVLLVPAKGEVKEVGRNVLVAWKSAAASARAMADARPLLANAKSITVLAVDEDGDGAASCDEAIAYLERHGLKAKAAVAKADDAGAAILSHAKKAGADLVVMGAFARPRFTEMVLGGATRTVLQDMASCVLMSH